MIKHKKIICLLNLLFAYLVNIQSLTAQADAGPDKTTCNGTPVNIGPTAAAADNCYHWEPATGLNNPDIANPTATATVTTTYTLTVTGKDFSFKANDNMVLTVLPAADCCPANAAIAPTPNPTTNNAAASNDCLPQQPILTWDVCFDVTNQLWYARVSKLECKGQINIKPWPSQPATMVVPNTANPVNGGNINNTVGSSNRWSYAISDMQDYDTPGGGAGPDWHSTAASSAHENFHWNTDWMTTCIGAKWPAAETAIEAFTSNATTKAAAKTAIEPQVNTRFGTFKTDLATEWNTNIAPKDSPGAGGGAYATGSGVLAGLINAVQAYRVLKGW